MKRMDMNLVARHVPYQGTSLYLNPFFFGLILCIIWGGMGCYDPPPAPSEKPICFLEGNEVDARRPLDANDLESNLCRTEDTECVDHFQKIVQDGVWSVKNTLIQNFSYCKMIEEEDFGYCNLGITQMNAECRVDRDCDTDAGESCVVSSGDICRENLSDLPDGTERCALCLNASTMDP